ncbi:MAG: amidohydrolase family protein [Flaviflexus sp.]|nr:amidohydrolase family protein [Flaviflexus sp.]
MIHLTGPILTRDGLLPEAWIVGETITFRPPAGAGGATEVAGFVTDGLVDAHCHIGLAKGGGAASREVALDQAHACIASGVTLVRDLGVPQDMSWIDGEKCAPHIIHCGTHIARPKRYLRGFGREIEVSELPEVVAEEAERSAGWVKLVGDWIDRSMGADADLTPLWPRDVLTEAVAAAHERGARVAVHTFATETIDDLLAAGVDGIEHGTGMTPDHMAEAARRAIPVTPTANQVSHFGEFADLAGEKYPVYARRMRGMYEGYQDHICAMAEAGIPLLMGSDAGGTLDFGTLPSELAACIEAGLDPELVLTAATHGARTILGQPVLAEGAPADLVVFERDPRSEPEMLANPVAVFRAGERLA